MEVREILSEKERPMLVIFDFKFRLHKKLANDVEKWCCTNKKCKSYVKRLNSEILRNQSKLEINDHNHEAKIEPIRNNRKIRISIKRKATETICRQSSKLIVSALKSSAVENIAKRNKKNTRKRIREAHKEILPDKPTYTKEVPEILRSLNLRINDGNFVNHCMLERNRVTWIWAVT